MEQIIPISVNDKFAYNIIITHNFSQLTNNLKTIKPDPSVKICLVADSNTVKLYAEEIKDELSRFYHHVLTYAIPAGEEFKTTETVGQLYEFLINQHLDRHDLLIALGGGVVGDLTGFTAATYLRGIDFVQVPTTLLSQVDSSIGGKTGVDHLQYKNMVGAFYHPRLVYTNTAVLHTLPQEQLTSGMGEVIKYGLIQRRKFYEWLKEHTEAIRSGDDEAFGEIIRVSCLCKKEVVEEDPTEQGRRAILNYGHTIGHAIEKLSHFSYLHGQCVALGMVAAGAISVKNGLIREAEQAELIETIRQFSLPLTIEGLEEGEVLAATKSDKKMRGGQIRFILLEEIGKAMICDTLTDADLAYGIRQVLV